MVIVEEDDAVVIRKLILHDCCSDFESLPIASEIGLFGFLPIWEFPVGREFQRPCLVFQTKCIRLGNQITNKTPITGKPCDAELERFARAHKFLKMFEV